MMWPFHQSQVTPPYSPVPGGYTRWIASKTLHRERENDEKYSNSIGKQDVKNLCQETRSASLTGGRMVGQHKGLSTKRLLFVLN